MVILKQYHLVRAGLIIRFLVETGTVTAKMSLDFTIIALINFLFVQMTAVLIPSGLAGQVWIIKLLQEIGIKTALIM